MKKFRADTLNNEVKSFEIISETTHRIIYKRPQRVWNLADEVKLIETLENKVSTFQSWFDTFDEAKNHLVKIQNEEISSIQFQLRLATEKLAIIEAMTEEELNKTKLKEKNIMSKVTYTGNDEETYSLYLDGVLTAELLVGEDGAIALVETIQNFLNSKITKNTYAVIQNDGDNLGIIVDIYENGTEEFIDTKIYMFDDFA